MWSGIPISLKIFQYVVMQSPTTLESTMLADGSVCACVSVRHYRITLLLSPLFWLLKKSFHPTQFTENTHIQQLSLIGKEVQGNLEYDQLQV